MCVINLQQMYVCLVSQFFILQFFSLFCLNEECGTNISVLILSSAYKDYEIL